MKTGEIALFLLIDLVIIMLAARALGWLARRVGQPVVIGEILAGILLGPSVLGRLAPGLPERLFPPEVPLRAIADLGLVFFMFLVGLELDTRLIRREGRRAMTISLTGVLLPLVLGMLLGIPLGTVNEGGQFLPDAPRPTSALSFPLFLGAAMCITAFPVLARILVERGLYKTGLGTAALCAAAVDDVIAWILLAAVVGLTRTGSPKAAGTAFLLTLLFVLFMLTVGKRLVGLLARRYEAVGQLSPDLVALILAGVLFSASMTEWIGIHSIFGGFLFGAIMPQQSRMTHELTDKVEDFTVVVLLPVFFAVAGLRTNLFALNSIELLGWLGLILAVAIGGKMIGCGLGARFNGFSWSDALVVGALMNTRGLTELVILTVGQSLGVLSDRTFAMMVIMALVTTIMAAPIINRLIPRKRMVQLLSGGDPPPVAMRVLAALGNPLNAPHLVDAAIRLTGQVRPAEVLLVRLIATSRAPEFRTGLLEEESQVEAALESMHRLADQAAASGVAARPISFQSDAVGQDFLYIAEGQHCDSILLGWHRPSLARHIIRANTHRLFEQADAEVVVLVDRQGEGMTTAPGRPVLVVLTGGDNDTAAAVVGYRVAASTGASVSLVALGESTQSLAAALSAQLRVLAEKLQQQGGVPVENPPPRVEGLSAVTNQSVEAVAIVAGLGPDWREGDFGHTTSAIADTASCPVFVVRGARAQGLRRGEQNIPSLDAGSSLR
jgi:Kef-type K+ transport system membrane component KefB